MATPRRPACLKIQTLALDVPILAGTARATSTDSSKGKPRLTISVEAAAVRIQGCSVGCRISRPTIALGQVDSMRIPDPCCMISRLLTAEAHVWS